jgi:hypothetical protein
MQDPAKLFSNAGAVVQAGAAFFGLAAFLLAEFGRWWRMWEIDRTGWIEIGVGVGGAAGLAMLAGYGVPS